MAIAMLATPLGAGAEVLYDQFDHPATTYAPSNQFIAGQQQLDSAVADDFSVPQGEVWTLWAFEVAGTYTGPCCLSLYVNVRVYANYGTLPGPVVVDRPGNPASHHPNFNGPFYGPFGSGAPVVVPGRYWFSVQQTKASSSIGETMGWSWQTRQVQSGYPAAAMDSSCPDWGVRATCHPETPEPDQIFRLFGWKVQEITLGKVVSRRNGTATMRATSAVPGTAVVADNRTSSSATSSVKAKPRIKRKAVHLPGPGITGRGTKVLPIRPTARIKKRLEKGRKVKLNVQVTFTPDGGIPYSQTKRVTLKRRTGSG